jgi:acyl-CoA thioesterase I
MIRAPQRFAVVMQIGVFAAVFQFLVGTLSAPIATAGDARSLKIVAFGDSLTAGFRLPAKHAFPIKLERALKANGVDVEIANAGVSGDTTAAGLERLDWAVPDGTDGVILELGANDALRGLDPSKARANLEAIIRRIHAKGTAVFLVGMHAPRNLGTEYIAAFDPIFPDLAKAHGLPFYPFFLDKVALRPDLNLDDGMHPNPRGVDVIVASILPDIRRWLADLTKRKTPG